MPPDSAAPDAGAGVDSPAGNSVATPPRADTTSGAEPGPPPVETPAKDTLPAAPARPGHRAAQASAVRETGPARSAAEAWKRGLVVLAETHGALANLLRNRARLEDWSPPRAIVHLSRLKDEDAEMIRDVRNRAACQQAFSKVAGMDVEVTLDDGAGTRPGEDDPFTREVADLFGGLIDDRSG